MPYLEGRHCCKEHNQGISRIYGVFYENQLRYVGQTTHSLKCRLNAHMSRARRTGRKTPFICWVRSLINKGCEPQINLIEDVKQTDGDQAEIYWIKRFKSVGCNLLNFSDGGNMCGFIGKKHSVEMRKYLSEKATGRRHSPEVIAKIVAKNKGRKQSAEEIERRAAKLRGLKRNSAVRKKMSERMLRDAPRKRIIAEDPQGIKTEYPSLRAASKAVGVAWTNISRAAKNPLYTSGGFKWRYADAH